MRLRNVEVIVRDLSAAETAWANASGLRRAAKASGRTSMRAGDVDIDLLAPEARPDVPRGLQERGEGLYQVVIETDALDIKVKALRAEGADVSEIEVGQDGLRSATISPASTHGVLIRLVEKSDGG